MKWMDYESEVIEAYISEGGPEVVTLKPFVDADDEIVVSRGEILDRMHESVEQAEAVVGGSPNIAPRDICEAADVPQGSTWIDVYKSILLIPA